MSSSASSTEEKKTPGIYDQRSDVRNMTGRLLAAVQGDEVARGRGPEPAASGSAGRGSTEPALGSAEMRMGSGTPRRRVRGKTPAANVQMKLQGAQSEPQGTRSLTPLRRKREEASGASPRSAGEAVAGDETPPPVTRRRASDDEPEPDAINDEGSDVELPGLTRGE